MGKKLVLLLCLGMIAAANADRNSGYVYTLYGDLLRDGYGHCIHTAYFDPDNGLAECGDAPDNNAH
jgi:hypothetical protein